MNAIIRTKAFGQTEAHIHVGDWSALVEDDGLTFRFEYGDYEFVEWIEDEQPAEPDCKCDLARSWRCYCGAVEPYRSPR